MSAKACLFFYADVLGYRSFLEQLGTRGLHRLLSNAIASVSTTVSITQTATERRRSMNAKGPARIRDFFRPLSQGDFSVFFAFDTLMVFLKDVRRESLWGRFDFFLEFAATLYLTLLIRYHVPLRGVITASESYMIGPRLITIREIDRCFQLEKAQDWSGTIIDFPHDELTALSDGFRLVDEPYMYYDVPFKSGSRDTLVLNPVTCRTLHMMKKRRLSLKTCAQWLCTESQREDLQPEVRGKYLNTYTFLNDCISRYETSVRICKPLYKGETFPNVP